VVLPDSTGEEDEDVESELKGVKLFVKHGGKDFTDVSPNISNIYDTMRAIYMS
jgi:hypothetical protein